MIVLHSITVVCPRLLTVGASVLLCFMFCLILYGARQCLWHDSVTIISTLLITYLHSLVAVRKTLNLSFLNTVYAYGPISIQVNRMTFSLDPVFFLQPVSLLTYDDIHMTSHVTCNMALSNQIIVGILLVLQHRLQIWQCLCNFDDISVQSKFQSVLSLPFI